MSHWACVIGHPVKHSLSPVMHNAGFQQLGLDAQYEAREVQPEHLASTVAHLRSPDCFGANVTAPHKLAIVPLLDELTDEARGLGAVNTVVNRQGHLLGHNTDASGLARWLMEAGIFVADRRAVVLGAGGAGRATVLALARLGAREVLVLNRTVETAEALVHDLRPWLGSTAVRASSLERAAAPTASPADIVVNATSLAHLGGAPTVHASWFGTSSTAVELAYNPPTSGFMRAARNAGARAENGLGMLIHQAILAFERWTGQTPPAEVFARAALSALEQRAAAGGHA